MSPRRYDISDAVLVAFTTWRIARDVDRVPLLYPVRGEDRRVRLEAGGEGEQQVSSFNVRPQYARNVPPYRGSDRQSAAHDARRKARTEMLTGLLSLRACTAS
jgi:hypothetical protein